jgi:hypothetical protein
LENYGAVEGPTVPSNEDQQDVRGMMKEQEEKFEKKMEDLTANITEMFRSPLPPSSQHGFFQPNNSINNISTWPHPPIPVCSRPEVNIVEAPETPWGDWLPIAQQSGWFRGALPRRQAFHDNPIPANSQPPAGANSLQMNPP